MPQPVFRFAPSPNGYLHLGHARSALLNADMARAAGGRFLLRIEDIDATRCRPEFEAAIYEDLSWLGLSWEERVRRQSDNLEAYREALMRLDALGLIYPSFESRGEIARMAASRGKEWPRDPDGAPLYPGEAKALTKEDRTRRMTAGEPYALRIDMAKAVQRAGALTWDETGEDVSSPLPPQAQRSGGEGLGVGGVRVPNTPHPGSFHSPTLPTTHFVRGGRVTDGDAPTPSTFEKPRIVTAAPLAWGDAILARKETPTSYHLSVVVDDALQGVTHVVRGVDLFWSTSVHRLLQALLGFPAPVYHHHPLILDTDGRKLAKSTESTSLRELRQAGATPADIRVMTGLA